MGEFVHVYNDGGGIRNVPMREGATRLTTDRVLYQSGIPFWIPPGDGGSNGLSFTGTRGVFTLSAAAPLQYSVAFTRNCYCYLPAGSGGLATGGWYWCQMSDDTNGEIFLEMYSGTGQPDFVSSPTAHPNLTATRITQTTSEITATAGVVPGGSMGPNGILRANCATRLSSSATTKGCRVKLSSNTFASIAATTTNNVGDFEGWIQNQGTPQKHSRVTQNLGRAHTTTTTLPASDSTATIQDTTVDTPWSLTMYLGANTDSCVVVLRKISIEYGA